MIFWSFKLPILWWSNLSQSLLTKLLRRWLIQLKSVVTTAAASHIIIFHKLLIQHPIFIWDRIREHQVRWLLIVRLLRWRKTNINRVDSKLLLCLCLKHFVVVPFFNPLLGRLLLNYIADIIILLLLSLSRWEITCYRAIIPVAFDVVVLARRGWEIVVDVYRYVVIDKVVIHAFLLMKTLCYASLFYLWSCAVLN